MPCRPHEPYPGPGPWKFDLFCAITARRYHGDLVIRNFDYLLRMTAPQAQAQRQPKDK